MTRKSRQRFCLSSCMFCFPANAKTQGCLITKLAQRRWSWNVCGCPCVFLGKSMVSPLVPLRWWNDSAWLFLSHLQECVRCHFGSAKQCWMPAQTKLLAMGTVEVLMRGLGERARKQPMAKAPMRCLPVSLPFPQHSNFAPLLSPSGTSSSYPAKGSRKFSPFRGAGWAEAPAATLLAPKRDNCCSSALTLLPSTCSPPAPAGSSSPRAGTAGLFMPWRLAHLGKDPLQGRLSWILGTICKKVIYNKVKNLLWGHK